MSNSIANWSPGEPNNPGVGEDCVHTRTDNKCWNNAGVVLCNRLSPMLQSLNYVLIEKELTFEQAEDYCQIVFDTHLATFADSNDYNEAGNLCAASTGTSCGIGLTDRANEGVFEWFDATEYNGVENWAPGEPNDSNNEDCVQISASSGTWNDVDCEKSRNFMCNLRDDIMSNNYIYVGQSLSWSDAENYCQFEYGTNLASMVGGSGEELTEIATLCLTKTCWIGLENTISDGATDGGDWYWSDWYSKDDSKITYEEAENYCEAVLQTNLATLPTQNTIMEASDLCKDSFRCMFGLHDRITEGKWEYIDGAELTVSNWSPNEPNDFGSGEDCANIYANNILRPELNFMWNVCKIFSIQATI